MSLSPKDVEDATKALESIINNDRLERVRTVLGQRTKNCKFLFENPNNPSNVWACLRTIDSFGIQDVDLVIESGIYQGKQSLSTKRGMRTAMGSAQWYVFMSVCVYVVSSCSVFYFTFMRISNLSTNVHICKGYHFGIIHQHLRQSNKYVMYKDIKYTQVT
jgi:tRNA G18 (ribose-2'-O)-methylase SpoU